jgi:hypothetical protein
MSEPYNPLGPGWLGRQLDSAVRGAKGQRWVQAIGGKPRCDNCRHWIKWTLSPDKAIAICGIAGSYDGEPCEASYKAYARDSAKYAAVLVTAPDFGCVQFEAKGQLATVLEAELPPDKDSWGKR